MSEKSEKPEKSKRLTYEDLKKRKKPTVKKVKISFDSQIADEFNSLRVAVEEARDDVKQFPRDKESRTKLVNLEEAFSEIELKAEESTVEFVFRSIGRAKFDEVMESCPPTDEQSKDAKLKGEDAPIWNGETFPPALVAAAIVDPELTEEQVFEIWEGEDWNHAEVLSLFMAALEVNQSRSVADLGKGFGTTPS